MLLRSEAKGWDIMVGWAAKLAPPCFGNAKRNVANQSRAALLILSLILMHALDRYQRGVSCYRTHSEARSLEHELLSTHIANLLRLAIADIAVGHPRRAGHAQKAFALTSLPATLSLWRVWLAGREAGRDLLPDPTQRLTFINFYDEKFCGHFHWLLRII
jgi:hypothetical protein